MGPVLPDERALLAALERRPQGPAAQGERGEGSMYVCARAVGGNKHSQAHSSPRRPGPPSPTPQRKAAEQLGMSDEELEERLQRLLLLLPDIRQKLASMRPQLVAALAAQVDEMPGTAGERSCGCAVWLGRGRLASVNACVQVGQRTLPPPSRACRAGPSWLQAASCS